MKIKLTNTQYNIFKRDPAYGFKGSVLQPLYGSGEHRSANALVNKGVGEIVSSQENRYHVANWFFKFNEGWRYNWNTCEIESS